MLTGPASSSPEARAALAACRSRMGGFLTSIGKNDEALAAYRLARSDQETLAAAPGASPQARRELGDTINRIGRLLANTGRPREATDEYRTALTIRKKLADDDPADSEFRNALAASHNNLGLVLWQTGRLKEAEAEYRTALAIREKLADDNPAVSEFRKQLQASHFNLANLLRQTGRLKEAEDLFRSALAIEQELAEANPAVPEFRRLLAINQPPSRDRAQAHGPDPGGRGRVPCGPVDAPGRWSRPTPPSQSIAATWGPPTASSASCSRNQAGPGRPRPSSARGSRTTRNWCRPPRRHRVPRSPGDQPRQPRRAALRGGRSSESEPEYRAAEAIFRDLAEANPAVTYFRYGLAYTQVRRGILLSQTGRLKEANSVFRSAAAIYQALADQSPKVPDYADGARLGAHASGRRRPLLRPDRPRPATPTTARSPSANG